MTKWYVPEANSAAALTLRARFRPPLVLTHLHRLELINAWSLKVFRGEISAQAAGEAVACLETDIDEGVWSLPDYDFGAVFTRAEGLSRRHTAAFGTRTLDVLHVAAALELRRREFVTGDDRQARLAAAAGLSVTRL